jgi:hypothetical protein
LQIYGRFRHHIAAANDHWRLQYGDEISHRSPALYFAVITFCRFKCMFQNFLAKCGWTNLSEALCQPMEM